MGCKIEEFQRIPTAKYILLARLSFTIMWQKFLYSVYRMLRNGLQDFFEPGIRFDVMHFASAEQAI